MKSIAKSEKLARPKSKLTRLASSVCAPPSKRKQIRGHLRNFICQELAKRDGLNCQICNESLPNAFQCDLDHIDGNPVNSVLSNLRRVHHNCNAKIAWNQRGEQIRQLARSSSSVCVSDHASATERTHAEVDYTTGTFESKVNEIAELPYREWITQFIRSHGSIRQAEAIDSGAEVIGVSVATTTRYLRKLISEKGPLKRWREPNFPKRAFILSKLPDLDAFNTSKQAALVTDQEIAIFQDCYIVKLN